MQTEPPDEMGRRRALLTDRERELIGDDDPDDENRRYQAVSRVRNKIEDELPRDLEILSKHHPRLFQELHDAVCEGDELRTPEEARVRKLEERMADLRSERDELKEQIEAESESIDTYDLRHHLSTIESALSRATMAVERGDGPDTTEALKSAEGALADAQEVLDDDG